MEGSSHDHSTMQNSHELKWGLQCDSTVADSKPKFILKLLMVKNTKRIGSKSRIVIRLQTNIAKTRSGKELT